MQPYNPDDRAKELHSHLGIVTQDKTTTAVGLTEENIGIVGSSEGRLRKIIRKLLFPFEVEAEGEAGSHAEQNVINEAKKREMKLTNMGASRDICIECQEMIENANIEASTTFSGKKSKERK
jgi:hypothetical protein